MYIAMARQHGYDVLGYIIDNWRIPGLIRTIGFVALATACIGSISAVALLSKK